MEELTNVLEILDKCLGDQPEYDSVLTQLSEAPPCAAFCFRLRRGHKMDTYAKRLRRAGLFVSSIKCQGRKVVGVVVEQEHYQDFADGE